MMTWREIGELGLLSLDGVSSQLDHWFMAPDLTRQPVSEVCGTSALKGRLDTSETYAARESTWTEILLFSYLQLQSMYWEVFAYY